MRPSSITPPVADGGELLSATTRGRIVLLTTLRGSRRPSSQRPVRPFGGSSDDAASGSRVPLTSLGRGWRRRPAPSYGPVLIRVVSRPSRARLPLPPSVSFPICVHPLRGRPPALPSRAFHVRSASASAGAPGHRSPRALRFLGGTLGRVASFAGRGSRARHLTRRRDTTSPAESGSRKR